MATPPDFTAGSVLTAAQMNAVGLWKITTGITATNGTVSNGTVTVNSAAPSVTVTGCFSSSFENYRIVISGGTMSAANNANFQLNGITTSSYKTAGSFLTYNSATLSGFGPATTTSWLVGFLGLNNTSIVMDIMNPNVAKNKGMMTVSSDTYNYNFTGECTSVSTSTGFLLLPAAGTMTGQKIRVYGYRN